MKPHFKYCIHERLMRIGSRHGRSKRTQIIKGVCKELNISESSFRLWRYAKVNENKPGTNLSPDRREALAEAWNKYAPDGESLNASELAPFS